MIISLNFFHLPDAQRVINNVAITRQYAISGVAASNHDAANDCTLHCDEGQYVGTINGICQQVFGDVTGLPEPKEDTVYIVSALVLAATDRQDVVAPATGHPGCVRNEKGLIESVPGFVRK